MSIRTRLSALERRLCPGGGKISEIMLINSPGAGPLCKALLIRPEKPGGGGEEVEAHPGEAVVAFKARMRALADAEGIDTIVYSAPGASVSNE